MRKLFAFILLTTLVSMANANPIKDTALLRKNILEELAKQPSGFFGVAFKDLATGDQFLLNEHVSFHAASTMKTPVLIETYKQAAMHKFAITDSILVKNTFVSIVDGSTYSLDSADDSEHDLYLHVGQKLPVSDVLFRMITESSNLATNIIIELVGAKNVTATMRGYGAKDIQVLRGVEDDKAFDLGLNNTTTAYDLMLIFEKIATETAVDKAASDAMIKILMSQHFVQVIPRKLPKDVKVANKTGSIVGVRHDSGIVFLPDGRKYVVVLLSKGINDDDIASETLSNVSKMLYDFVISTGK